MNIRSHLPLRARGAAMAMATLVWAALASPWDAAAQQPPPLPPLSKPEAQQFMLRMFTYLPRSMRTEYETACADWGDQCPMADFGQMAQITCQVLDSGAAKSKADMVKSAEGGLYRPEELGAMVEAAIDILCPRHMNKKKP